MKSHENGKHRTSRTSSGVLLYSINKTKISILILSSVLVFFLNGQREIEAMDTTGKSEIIQNLISQICSDIQSIQFSEISGECLADELTAAIAQNKTAEDSQPQPIDGDDVDRNGPNDGERNGSYAVIPVFYHKLPKSTDRLAQKIREEARTLFLQKRSKELLDNAELKMLWNLLQKNFSPPAINNEQFISYDDYLRVVKEAGEKFK